MSVRLAFGIVDQDSPEHGAEQIQQHRQQFTVGAGLEARSAAAASISRTRESPNEGTSSSAVARSSAAAASDACADPGRTLSAHPSDRGGSPSGAYVFHPVKRLVAVRAQRIAVIPESADLHPAVRVQSDMVAAAADSRDPGWDLHREPALSHRRSEQRVGAVVTGGIPRGACSPKRRFCQTFTIQVAIGAPCPRRSAPRRLRVLAVVGNVDAGVAGNCSNNSDRTVPNALSTACLSVDATPEPGECCSPTLARLRPNDVAIDRTMVGGHRFRGENGMPATRCPVNSATRFAGRPGKAIPCPGPSPAHRQRHRDVAQHHCDIDRAVRHQRQPEPHQ